MSINKNLYRFLFKFYLFNKRHHCLFISTNTLCLYKKTNFKFVSLFYISTIWHCQGYKLHLNSAYENQKNYNNYHKCKKNQKKLLKYQFNG